ncbi:hypothetical protein A5766_11255 [Gordonia sp. 852002-51296_SCH5728562-b]|nr:hypothetical protein A5766_11255 [Gordonia sp. 852002-51296_SCH5728562-b]
MGLTAAHQGSDIGSACGTGDFSRTSLNLMDHRELLELICVGAQLISPPSFLATAVRIRPLPSDDTDEVERRLGADRAGGILDRPIRFVRSTHSDDDGRRGGPGLGVRLGLGVSLGRPGLTAQGNRGDGMALDLMTEESVHGGDFRDETAELCTRIPCTGTPRRAPPPSWTRGTR